MARESDVANEEGRLRLLELAASTGNVSEACRHSGVSRAQYYRFKRRFELHGKQGLSNRLPIARAHPSQVDPSVVERILELALSDPAAGCDRISSMLSSKGVRVSGVTVQKYLDQSGLGLRRQRAQALETQAIAGTLLPSERQVAFLAHHNPAYRERENVPEAPAYRLFQATSLLPRFNGFGRLYLHSVIDGHTQQAFALISSVKSAEAAVTLLFGSVLPFYEMQQIAIGTIQTDGSREFAGTPSHPYSLFLLLNDIGHDLVAGTNGWTERFARAAISHFSRRSTRLKRLDRFEDVERELAEWLTDYNRSSDHHSGFPNQGLSPVQRLLSWISSQPVTEGC